MLGTDGHDGIVSDQKKNEKKKKVGFTKLGQG